MFEKLYKSVDMQVMPTSELINETKEKMYKEIKTSNKVKYMNFYKYGTVAACLIIFIGVFSINPTKDAHLNQAPSINESIKDTAEKDFVSDSFNNMTGNSFSNNSFNSATSSDSASAITVKRPLLDNIIEFFVGIIQWFKELLF